MMQERKASPESAVEDAARRRELTIWFEGTVVDGMEWSFEPTQRSVKVSFEGAKKSGQV